MNELFSSNNVYEYTRVTIFVLEIVRIYKWILTKTFWLHFKIIAFNINTLSHAIEPPFKVISTVRRWYLYNMRFEGISRFFERWKPSTLTNVEPNAHNFRTPKCSWKILCMLVIIMLKTITRFRDMSYEAIFRYNDWFDFFNFVLERTTSKFELCLPAIYSHCGWDLWPKFDVSWFVHCSWVRWKS